VLALHTLLLLCVCVLQVPLTDALLVGRVHAAMCWTCCAGLY
jgi:hypothetical protein